MNNIKIDIPAEKIEHYSNYSIVYYKNNKYLIKAKNENNYENINYLEKIGCYCYLPVYKNLKSYKIYLYPEDIVDYRKKLKYLVLTLVDIHKNSLEVYDYAKEEVDTFYNNELKKINDTMEYYLKFQDYIEEMDYISEDYYELLINMSKIYRLLSLSRKFLDEWYYSDKKYREVFLINNVSIDNFIYSDKGYFVDLSNCHRGNIIDDIVNIYKENYYNDINNLFDLYIDNIELKESEIKFFFSKIALIEKLKLKNNSSSNIKLVKEIIDYVDKTIDFISEEDKKYQQTNKEVFKEENKNIKFSSNEKEN